MDVIICCVGSALKCAHQECKLVQQLWRMIRSFLNKLKIELPCDPAISLLGTYLEKNVV